MSGDVTGRTGERGVALAPVLVALLAIGFTVAFGVTAGGPAPRPGDGGAQVPARSGAVEVAAPAPGTSAPEPARTATPAAATPTPMPTVAATATAAPTITPPRAPARTAAPTPSAPDFDSSGGFDSSG